MPLEGTVTLDGKPLAGATVAFDRTDGPIDQRLYQGKTDAVGKYAAGPTWTTGVGVAPGSYKVLIRSVEIPAGANELTKLPPEPVPMSFRDGSLKIDVPSEGNAAANFEMQRGR